MSALLAVLGPSAAKASDGGRSQGTSSMAGAPWTGRVVDDVTLIEGAGFRLLARADPAIGRLSVSAAGSVWAAADAALYYRGDLRARLGDAGVGGSREDSPAALAVAAYVAWGSDAASRLEGDLALILWDASRRRLVASRDFVGRRPLYIASLADGGLAVASEVRALLALPGCPRTLSPAAIAGVAAGLPESPWDTAYSAIRVLPAGRTLVATLDRDGRVESVVTERHWTPPTFESGGGPRFDEAAEELQRLLRAAVVERMDAGAPTGVWLSGGWDSTAVYGAGRAESRDSGARGDLRAVSMTYPVGDPGREDDLITRVTGHWGAEPLWCDSAPIGLFGDVTDEAMSRDLPFAHPYALWTRELAAATVAHGARVALDGSGGDQLFQLSPVYLADLVRGGRWLAARREWGARDMRGLGWRRFVRYAVLPLLSPATVRAITALRGGRQLHGIRAWPLPPWIRPAFAAANDLGARAGSRLPRRAGERHGAHESRWFFESSYSPTVLAAQAADARRAGIELRSPLLDARIIALAARRPREERSDRGQTKRLLRAAARGLVPDDVLAPRGSRTGTTTGYYRQRLLAELPELARRVLPVSALADLGMVDPAGFADAIRRSVQDGVQEFDVALFYTIQAELWLRAHG
ncbi:MAG: asparagine synthetase B family protein [Gemmatimonadaceae bacterium]